VHFGSLAAGPATAGLCKGKKPGETLVFSTAFSRKESEAKQDFGNLAGRFFFFIQIDRLTACIELFSACKLASACISKESEDKHFFSSPALLSAIGGGAINF
jgi:hypothetical protein